MYSAKSLNGLPADASALLERALTHVAEESFFALVEPVDAAGWGDLCAAHDAWLDAAVAVTGARAGTFHCRLPRALAYELAAAFLGLPPHELDPASDSVTDLTGELANMVCGQWLSTLASNELFELGKPSVTQCGEGGDASGYRTSVNGMPIAIEVFGS